MDKINIYDLSLLDLENIFRSWDEPPYRARQVLGWIFKKNVFDFAQMSDLSAALRKKMQDRFVISGLKIVRTLSSADGTEKFLLSLDDGNFIEAVNIPTERRLTGCVSSQVGCKYACKFCASGLSGFKRNLSCGEIIREVEYLRSNSGGKDLTHIVFMGTGEPMDNYDNVLKAIRIINADYGINIGARRITISTSGIIPGIKRLAEENIQVELSVSLHAADDKTRSLLMPVNKVYPLVKLIGACKDYIIKTNRQVTFEYCLIQGLNSGLHDANNLSKIMKTLGLAKVNLIPANPVKECGILPPGRKDITVFKEALVSGGVEVTLRKPRGQDIDAACGQLRLGYERE